MALVSHDHPLVTGIMGFDCEPLSIRSITFTEYIPSLRISAMVSQQAADSYVSIESNAGVAPPVTLASFV